MPLLGGLPASAGCVSGAPCPRLAPPCHCAPIPPTPLVHLQPGLNPSLLVHYPGAPAACSWLVFAVQVLPLHEPLSQGLPLLLPLHWLLAARAARTHS